MSGMAWIIGWRHASPMRRADSLAGRFSMLIPIAVATTSCTVGLR